MAAAEPFLRQHAPTCRSVPWERRSAPEPHGHGMGNVMGWAGGPVGQSGQAGVHGVVPMPRLGGSGQPPRPCSGTEALLQGAQAGVSGRTPPWPGLKEQGLLMEGTQRQSILPARRQHTRSR